MFNNKFHQEQMENMTLLLFTILIFIYFHRILIMLCLSPITAWATKNHDTLGIKRKSISRKLADKYCWWFERLFLYWCSNIHSHHIRNFFYKNVHQINLDKNVVIYWGAEIRNPAGLHIGKGTIIGDKAILDARAKIEIGENVNLSSNVSIWTLQHDYRDPDFKCNPNHYGPVKIGNRAWIGPNSIILRNVTIGEGAVIAAGSVVTHDVPPFELWGGIPARSLGKRPQNMCYEFKGIHCHFL